MYSCPRPQWRATDDLLSKAYDAAARMGRIGNSLSHLTLTLSASLQEAMLDASVHSFGDASLQAFVLMSRELGRLMSTLVQARRQVWLAKLPLTRHVGEPSAASQWNPARFLGRLLSLSPWVFTRCVAGVASLP